MNSEHKIPPGLDHIIIAVQDLELGMDYVEEKLGLRPIRAGRHPKYGTHNALLALKPSHYLEVIAPDPNLKTPIRGRFLENKFRQKPSLVTWVLRTSEIENLVANTQKLGIDIGKIESGSRLTPDGNELSWKVSDPYAMLYDGAIPFIIDWGNTPHPSSVLPVAGELIQFRIEHPSPVDLKKLFKAIQTDVEIVESKEFKMFATINIAGRKVEI